MKGLLQTRRGIAFLALASAFVAPAAAQNIDVRITADNAYRFGFGPVNGFTPASPIVENFSTPGEIFSCSAGTPPPSPGPEVYSVLANPSDFLYIVAYDDDFMTQGLLGEFQFGANPKIYTGPAWQVCAIGNKSFGSGGPDAVTQIVPDIIRCNAGDPTLTSKGWVGFTTTTIGRLEVGEPNAPSAPDVFSPVCTSGPNSIDGGAHWIWYDPDPATLNWPATTSPFEPGSSPDGEYLIFRLGMGEVPGVSCTTMEVRAQYAAKFFCNHAVENPLALVRGFYGTAIEVHNPDLPPAANEKVRPARLAKKVAVALPGEKVGRVSPYRLETLGPDQAFEIDCAEILRIAGVSPGFLTGFVVIDSDRSLDVTAVYSGRPLQGQVSTLDVEVIQERRMDGKLTICP